MDWLNRAWAGFPARVIVDLAFAAGQPNFLLQQARHFAQRRSGETATLRQP
jgi:hypothetical protein